MIKEELSAHSKKPTRAASLGDNRTAIACTELATLANEYDCCDLSAGFWVSLLTESYEVLWYGDIIWSASFQTIQQFQELKRRKYASR
jgi:hypothetical protein